MFGHNKSESLKLSQHIYYNINFQNFQPTN